MTPSIHSLQAFIAPSEKICNQFNAVQLKYSLYLQHPCMRVSCIK